MKKPLMLLQAICMFAFAEATTYYSKSVGAPNLTTTWRTSRNGTGFAPSNFSNGDIFIIQAGQYLTTTATWTISGTNATIIIESGATLQADDKITVRYFEMYEDSYYIHNVANSTFPGSISRTLDATSTVEIKDWSGSTALPDATLWGNLTIDLDNSYNSNWNQAGTLTDIAGDFTIISTGNSTKEFRLANGQDYTLTIGGDFIIEGGYTEASNSNTAASQTIIIGGAFYQSGGTFTRSNNREDYLSIQFNGTSSSFTKTAGTLTNTYINWVVNGSKTLSLNNDLPVASGRSATINGTLNCNYRAVSGAGSFILNSTAKLTTWNASGIDGCITTTGTKTFNAAASYQFYTATTVPFPGSGTFSAKDISINANVTINKDLSVSGTLTLNAGKLTIPAGNTVVITSGNSIGGSSFDATKHIATLVNTSTGTKGVLRITNFSGSKTFPIGNGTYYMPVVLTIAGTNDFSASVFQGATTNGTPNGTAFTASEKQKVVDAIWVVNKNNGASSATMQVQWPSALEGSSFVSFLDNQIGLSHYDGSRWDLALGIGSQSLNTATRSSILSFSPFGVSKIGIPLPVKFSDIKISQKNTGLQVAWSNLAEANVDHYEIERAQDGQHFSFAGQVAAVNNNNSAASYSWIDAQPLQAVTFYRIKAVDKDGKFIYSTIVRIDPAQSTPTDLLLYPNPAFGKTISLQAGNIKAGEYKISIYDNGGRIIYSEHFDHHGGAINQAIQLPGSMKAGIYSLQVSGSALNLSKSFIMR